MRAAQPGDCANQTRLILPVFQNIGRNVACINGAGGVFNIHQKKIADCVNPYGIEPRCRFRTNGRAIDNIIVYRQVEPFVSHFRCFVMPFSASGTVCGLCIRPCTMCMVGRLALVPRSV